MKYFLFVSFALVVCLSACYKQQIDSTEYSASVSVTNALADYSAEMVVDFTDRHFDRTSPKPVNYSYFDGQFTNGTVTYAVPAGDRPVKIVLASDSSNVLYHQPFNFAAGDNYSLFVSGNVDTPVGLMVKNEIPARLDSTTGVRFINLSPNSPPLDIRIADGMTPNLVSALSYQQITNFKPLDARADRQDYLFEIADAVTGKVLTHYFYYNLARQKNITLLIRGIVNGDPGLELFRVNNY